MFRILLVWAVILLSLAALAQQKSAFRRAAFRIDSLPTQGILLDKGWKFHAGDNPDFAKADFDDSAWEGIDPTKNIIDLPQIPLSGQIFWLRNTFSVGQLPAMIMQLEQIGATQIFLNGKQIHAFGNFDKNHIKAITPAYKPLSCPIVSSGQYVMSVRYVCEPNVHYSIGFGNTCALFKLQFFTPENWHKFYKWKEYDKDLNIVVSSFFICLCLLFFAFYLFFPDRKINLFFTIYTFLSGIPYFCYGFFYDISQVAPVYWLHNFNIIFGVIGYICIQTALHNQFEQKKGILFWFFVVLGLVSTVLSFFYYWGWQVYGVMVNFLGSFAIMLLGIRGRMAQKTGATIIAMGGGFFFIFWIGFLTTVGKHDVSPFFYALAQISVPISIAIFVGHDLAQTNTALQQKLTENEALASEKQQILSTQNETLERQVAERTAELEYKNRDLEIEASLERVRTRAMAMRTSEEINALIGHVFMECRKLGMPVTRCTIMTFDKITNDAVWWMANAESIAEPMNYHVKHHDLAPTLAYLQAWQNREQTWTYVLENEDKKTWNDYMFDKTGLSKLPNSVKDSMRSYTKVFLNASFGSFGGITFTSFAPLSDEYFDVLARVTNVFDLTYTRYLDLQKAEAQAREAQVEAALERIRSASLSMRKSDELNDVVSVFNEKLKELVPTFTGGAGIHIFEEGSKDAAIWVIENNQPPAKINLPYDEEDFKNNSIILDVWNAKETARNIVNKTYSFEEKNRYFQYVFKHNTGQIPEMVKNFILSASNYTATFVYEANSMLGGNNWTDQPVCSVADFEILKRIAKVFDQAYIRFLDLQKAEAQAREAQIEAALERVRSRTIAMQSSSELADTSILLFQQVQALGIPSWSCGFNIFEKGDNECTGWMSSNGILQPPFKVPLSESPTFMRFYESKQQNEDFYVETVEGATLESHYRYMMSLSGFKEIGENFVKSGFSFPTLQMNHIVNFTKGNLIFITGQPIPESHDILKRFASVFEQTYTRFLDLQKVEAQALEVLKRSTVDRVRAEIASMRTTGDLERITPLIWNELTTLGVPFIRCGVFIMDEEQEQIHTFLSTPDGKAIASFNTSFSNPGLLAEALPHWRNKAIYQTHWDEATFLAQAKMLIEQGAFLSPEKYLSESRPTGLYLHFLPFLQGMLYVGNDTNPLTDDQLKLVQTLAEAFSSAYARYEDFNKLELAKKQVESTLTELRSTQAQLIQKEKLASLGELTAGIAHEIQNPLNFVNNFSELSVELIQEISPPTPDGEVVNAPPSGVGGLDWIPDTPFGGWGAFLGDITQNLEKINHHGKRASSIVKGMLEHSRMGTGERALTDINQLADEYLRLAYHGLRAKDNTFNSDYQTDFDENLPKIEVIPQDIGRVLLNLINNAFYAVNSPLPPNGGTKKTPLVTVSTKYITPPLGSDSRRAGGAIEISVRDNGTGIPEEVQSKIFQPFFTTKPTGQGTGLGLSLAYDIVTKGHGGTIEVESVEGKGTIFTVKLPILT